MRKGGFIIIIMCLFLFGCSKSKENVSGYTIKNNIVYAFVTPTTMDAETFVSLGNCYYAKDKNNVYYGSVRLMNGDTKTIACLGIATAKDKNHVYEKGEIKENLDANSFVYFNKYYAKDKNNVYVDFQYAEGGSILSVADIETFQGLNEFYAKDKNNVYAQKYILPFADINTFEIVDQAHAKDKNYKYEGWNINDCFNISKEACKQKNNELNIMLYEEMKN